MGYPFWLLKEYKKDGLWLRWKMLLRWFLAINKLWSTLQHSHGLKREQFDKNAHWLVKQIISGFQSYVGSDSILSHARRYTCLCKISRFLKIHLWMKLSKSSGKKRGKNLFRPHDHKLRIFLSQNVKLV